MLPNDTPNLPQKVTDVPRDVLRNFPHSKKVGNYLLGNTLGEGSFAKVKEALHIPTGERVSCQHPDPSSSTQPSIRKSSQWVHIYMIIMIMIMIMIMIIMIMIMIIIIIIIIIIIA